MMVEVMWRRQKGRKSHIDAAINGLWRCPSIDVNARSGDCHATDALRATSRKQGFVSGLASPLVPVLH